MERLLRGRQILWQVITKETQAESPIQLENKMNFDILPDALIVFARAEVREPALFTLQITTNIVLAFHLSHTRAKLSSNVTFTSKSPHTCGGFYKLSGFVGLPSFCQLGTYTENFSLR